MQPDQQIQFKITEKFTKERIEEIQRIKETEGLTAETIAENARDKNNPLHDLFDWDDRIAGPKWRFHQARVLLNEIKLITPSGERFAFENVRLVITEKVLKREYKSVAEIMDNEEWREQVLKKAYDALLYWQSQYSNFSEFAVVHKAIEQMGQQLEV